MSPSPSSSPLDRSVCYPPAQASISIRRDVTFACDRDPDRLMDIYSPASTETAPAIVIASGYSKAGLTQHVGRSARGFGSAVSWARLLASHGIAAITYDAVHPAEDLRCLFERLRTEGSQWGIDGRRLGVFACSGNAPVALRAVSECTLRCAIVMYGFLLDTGGSATARASQRFGFADACAGLGVTDLCPDTHLLLIRAGKDAFEGLNETFDGLTSELLRRNLPVTIVNHANAAHAFDLMDDCEETRHVIRHVLDFVQCRLR